MSAPGEPTTMRARLEAILAWSDDWFSDAEDAQPVREQVKAALAILDNADRVEHFPEGWCEVSDDNPRGDTCRVVPDPVRLVGRVEPHDDNGDTT